MRVIIAAVGKLKDGGERDLLDRYHKRFDQSGRALGLGPLSIIELPESRLPETDARKADEAARLLKAIGDAGLIIALDEHGSHITSDAFSKLIGRHRDDGIKSLALLIGGPDGHGQTALQTAHIKLSLGAMTLPHGLARVILSEQLYRATTILAGHPYHRA
jgi:23S rRNA (pseudouridine1915-N3)-methyltransferase